MKYSPGSNNVGHFSLSKHSTHLLKHVPPMNLDTTQLRKAVRMRIAFVE